jgi:hypothetical protein
MSQLLKMKCQANYKDFERFGAFKGLVEQKKTLYSIRSCVNWALFGTRGPLKRSCQKKHNLHLNSLYKLLLIKCAFNLSLFSKYLQVSKMLIYNQLPHLSPPMYNSV